MFIKRVTFYLDGHKLVTDKTAPFKTRVKTSKSGKHRVVARVVFKSESFTKARKIAFNFRRCTTHTR